MSTTFWLEYNQQQRNFSLDAQMTQVRIGRGATNEVAIGEDRGISKCHARIFASGGKVWVEDTGSRNGTFVNEKQVGFRHPLEDGDTIRLGNTHLVFRRHVHEDPQETFTLPGMTCIISIKDFKDQWKTREAAAQAVSGPAAPPKPATAKAEAAPAAPPASPVVDTLAAEVKRFGVLQEIASSLLDQRDLNHLFHDCLQLIVSVVPARRGCLMMIEGGELQVKSYWTGGRVADTPAAADIIQFSRTVQRLVIEKKSAVLTTNVESDPQLEEARSIIVQGIKSIMCVPLWNGEKTYGLIYLDSPSIEKDFNKDNLQLLTAIANLVTMKIENYLYIQELLLKKAIEKELEYAADVQKFLIPERFPQVSDLDGAVFYRSCLQLAGDYYHVFVLPDGRYLFIIADVMGKGMGAALLTASLHAYLNSLCERALDLGELLGDLNRRIHTQCDGQIFVTLFALAVDAASGRAWYCNAGHNEAIRVREDGSSDLFVEGGPILGILPEGVFQVTEAELGDGDLLLLYTDGLTEAGNDADEFFGRDRVVQFLVQERDNTPDEICERLIQTVEKFQGAKPQRDDLTGILIRFLPGKKCS